METRFNKKVCKDLGLKVDAALKEALKDSGFKVALAGGSFEDLVFTMRLKFSFADGETKEHKDYREHAALPYTSFPPNMLDASFPYGKSGEVITVIGWLPNRPKMDILLRDATGKDKIAPSISIIPAYEREFGKYTEADNWHGKNKSLTETAPPATLA